MESHNHRVPIIIRYIEKRTYTEHIHPQTTKSMIRISPYLRTALLIPCLLGAMQGMAQKYSWEDDLHHRLLCDFTQSREEVVDYISRFIPAVTDEKMTRWEASGALECMELDGKKMYCHAAGRNLFRRDPKCRQIW